MDLFYASYGTMNADVVEVFKRLNNPLKPITETYLAANKTVVLIQSTVPLKHPFEQYDPAKHNVSLPSGAAKFGGIVIVSSEPEALGGVQQQKRSGSKRRPDPSIERLQRTAMLKAVIEMTTWKFSKAA
jgi:hypothetical protein